MTALNLHDVYDRLTSNQGRSRQTALNDLQRFFAHEDASSQLNDEDQYAGLLQALIHNFKLELAGFRKSNSAPARTLLHRSAECFAIFVEKARLVMTRPTVKMIVNHILEDLPLPESAEYGEVASSFFASLKFISSYPPHIEQMKK